MNFLHISDTHYLNDYSKVNDGFKDAFKVMTNPLTQLKELVDEIKVPIDFVIHSGDLTHSGDLIDYVELKKGLIDIFGDTKILVTPGNHDNSKELKKVFEPNEDPTLPLVTYNKFNDLGVISFDSMCETDQNGEVTDEVCSKVLEILDNNKNEKILLFTHHHLIKDQFELPSAKINKLFDEIINRKEIIGLITGHTHHVYSTKYNGKDYFTGNGVSFSVENENGELIIEERSGIQLFTFENDKLEMENILQNKPVKKIGILKF
ncbi:MAG: metallophosphoesterase [Peptostreptococcaceae bacterium]